MWRLFFLFFTGHKIKKWPAPLNLVSCPFYDIHQFCPSLPFLSSSCHFSDVASISGSVDDTIDEEFNWQKTKDMYALILVSKHQYNLILYIVWMLLHILSHLRPDDWFNDVTLPVFLSSLETSCYPHSAHACCLWERALLDYPTCSFCLYLLHKFCTVYTLSKLFGTSGRHLMVHFLLSILVHLIYV